MSHHHDDEGDGVSRRHALECMLWAGTGVLWAVSGGVPKSLGLLEPAAAATAAATGFTFLQISDSHIGFNKAANPDVTRHAARGHRQDQGACREARDFMLHTGDITHLSKAERFDNADQIIDERRPGKCFYVPGEHDIVDEGTGKAVPRALRQEHQGQRLVQLRPQRRALHRPRQRRQPQSRRPGLPRPRPTRLARRRSSATLGLHADRRLCPHPALVGLSGLGLGHGRQRAGALAISSASARSPCSTATSTR